MHRTFRVLAAVPLLFVVALAGCGAEPELGTSAQESGAAAAPVGVQISGAVANEETRHGEMLVFAYVDLAPNEPPANSQAAGVAGVGDDGGFLLTTPSAKHLTIVFLHDKESDGAIDMGDPIAVLLDPEEALQELGDGAAVVLSDVTIDFFRSRAGAESMDVRNSSVADVTATADPSPQTE
jgi:hypothetical protein